MLYFAVFWISIVPLACFVVNAIQWRNGKTDMRSVTASSEMPVWNIAVSWVLLIPLLTFASTGVFWFQVGRLNTALTQRFGVLGSGETSTTDNIANTVLLLSILAAVLLPWMKSVTALLRHCAVFAAIAAWPILSCIWSQLPGTSLEWSVIAAVEVLFAFYLYRRFTPSQTMQLIMAFGWICLALSICIVLILPRYGIDHSDAAGAWRGLYFHKNLCSMTTLFLMLVGIYSPATNFLSKALRAAYVCLSVFVVVMTRSATGKTALVCLFAYILFTKVASRFRSRDRGIVFGLGLALALLIGGVGIVEESEIATFLGKDPTLTGRTEIWEAVIPSIMKHPILGYGYRAFWRGYQGDSASVSLATHWSVTSAHNAYLEVWLGLGLVGVGLVVISLVKAVRDAFVCLSADNSPYFNWYASIVFVTLLFSLDEGGLVAPSSMPWILYIFACVGLSEGARKIRLGTDHG